VGSEGNFAGPAPFYSGTMQSDDLFIRKFRRQNVRPPIVNFDPKREAGVVEWPPRRDGDGAEADSLTPSRLGANPPEPDGFFRGLSTSTGDSQKPAKPPKPEGLSKKSKPTPPPIPQPSPYDNLGGGTWVRSFAHYDIQSILFDLNEVATNRDSGGGVADDPEQSLLLDEGDGNDNELLLSCPHFRNETGGEEQVGLCQSSGRRGLWSSLRTPNDAVSVLEEPRESHVQLQGKSNYFIEHADLGAHYYRKYFYMKEHQNFFGIDDRLGPVAISFRREEKEGSSGAQYNYRIIFRTTEMKTLRGSILEESVPSAARHTTPRGLSPKRLLEFILPELNLHCLRLASNSPKVRDTLLKLDEQGLNFQRKVGVMYCRAGQSSEEDMYNNESSGPAFEEFLDLLGDRVRLKGWEKYRAQLDNKTDSTGKHSLYTRYQDYEIMFHVSTMLPYTANNTQQLLRKRHIGNDIVTIVFQEPGALPFTPKSIRSHFQHVFIIVQVHQPCAEETYYSVAVTRSKDIPLFGPLFPKGARFPRSLAFRDFLLAKVVNAENAAEKAEKFRSMATRTRQEYLKDLAENYRGESVSISMLESQVEDLKEVVQRLEMVTRGCVALEVTPLRDGVGQPGFLMDEEGFVTELQRFCYAESGGLQLWARVVRLCGHSLVHLSLEERTRLLRTAHKIHITVIPPDENGKPRRLDRLQNSQRVKFGQNFKLKIHLLKFSLVIINLLSSFLVPRCLLDRHVYDNVALKDRHIYENVRELRDDTPDLILAVKPKVPLEEEQVTNGVINLHLFLPVLSETTDSTEEEWQSIADLATACRSILEALSREGEDDSPGHLEEKVSQLEAMLKKLQDDLQKEKEDKAMLQAEVQSLRQNNQRLQEESQSTVARLIKVTELLCNVNKPC
uniref:Signal-induced proliferation-associated 1 n=1 Tax=Oryzias sinensis TaxID=183150 RepID=A0A8C8A697_9TELE